MRNRKLTNGKRRSALPSIVLVALAAAMLMAATAGAEDPPIISVGPIDAGGTTVSGTAGSDPQADACIGDDHSGADPADPDVVELNDSTCGTSATSSTAGGAATGGGSSTSGGTAGSVSSAGSGSTTRSSSTASVTATQAVGLQIVRIRHLTKTVRSTRQFRVLVTLRDSRGRLVNGAFVSVNRVPGSRKTVSGVHGSFSNKIGQARVLVPVTKRMFGKRLFLKISARTPSARAVALRSVFLPRLR
jgi:hypothetical protein